jgi:hypothetical protein
MMKLVTTITLSNSCSGTMHNSTMNLFVTLANGMKL